MIQNIKYENQNFKQEVTMQNRMLESLQVDIDDSHANMVKLDTRLKQIVSTTSTCKLWLVVVCEIFLLFFILLWL